jgi:RNA polymerase sigma-70 factor (ECF subfamily)
MEVADSHFASVDAAPERSARLGLAVAGAGGGPVADGGLSDGSAASSVGDPEGGLRTRADFDAAVRAHLPRLFRYALARTRDQAEAEDVLQAGLVRAWIHREGHEGRGSVLGWLLAVIRAEHLDRLRGARRRLALFEAFGTFIRDGLGRLSRGSADDIELTIAGHIDASHVRRAILELSEPHRDVIVLCDLEELPHEVVARTLGVAAGTVKSRHHRARRELAALLQRKALLP